MILQDRDRKILSALNRYGVLSTDQIAAQFFDGVAYTTVMRRLRKLEQDDVILRVRGLPNALNAWCLTISGGRTVGVEEPPTYTNQNTILHEVKLSELRLRLESMGLGNDWTSEQEIRKHFNYRSSRGGQDEQIIPDGVFVAKSTATGVVAVELELHAKAHLRYRKILSQYAEKDSIRWIWYVVESTGIGNTVFSQWSKVRRYESSPRLMCSILSEVLKFGDDATIHFHGGEKRKIRDEFITSPLPNRRPTPMSNSAQEVSKLNENPLSNRADKNCEEKQRFKKNENENRDAPSALDHSPSTMGSGRGLQA